MRTTENMANTVNWISLSLLIDSATKNKTNIARGINISNIWGAPEGNRLRLSSPSDDSV